MMKKLAAGVVSLALALPVLAAQTATAVMEPGAIGLAQRTAQEGIVMVKNDDAVLPLTPNRTVSVFGRVQVNYFPVGYGSGGDVKFTHTTNLLQGLQRNPGITVNQSLAKIYEDWCAAHKPDDGGWAQWPLSHKEMPLTDSLVAEAAAVSETAVVVIGRSAGESYDQQYAKGSFFLTDAENQMLQQVNDHFDKVVVLLNVGNLIDMQWVAKYPNIKSLLFVWQGGQESGNAVANVLAGDESPSGKLPDTVAIAHSDYPTDGNFGQNNPIYQEDIFLGYRYFETFAQDRVLYPFGFGLSYTTFEQSGQAVSLDGPNIKVKTTVTNTGTRPGKEVVQVYYGAPQGQLGKAAKSLAGYAKTGTLQPGASETVTISFPFTQMASYDDAGKAGHKSAWILEAGDYPIYVGNSVAAATQAGSVLQASLRVVKQSQETLAPTTAFNRWAAVAGADGKPVLTKTEAVPQANATSVRNRILDYAHSLGSFAQTGVDQGIKLIDVYNDPTKMADFVSQLSLNDLAALTFGPGQMDPPTAVLGSAGVLGGYTASLQHYGITPETLTDGPSGIRIAESATLLPIGTLLAATFNDQLVEDLYASIGAEMIRNGSSSLLAPGMNIHRDPLCGRNFEYFSEDPLLAGQIGAAFVRGLQSQGVAATPKHYAANNQETARSQGNSQVSERALREIYLKAFEIMVRSSQPRMVMTSYNNVNGTTASTNWQLVTAMLRQEFGFTGLVMTDWGGGGNADPTGLSGDPARLRAGTDVLEQGSTDYTSVLSSLNQVDPPPSPWGPPASPTPADAWLELGEVQQAAIRVLNDVMKSFVFRSQYHLPLYDYSSGEYEPSYRAFSVSQPSRVRPAVDRIYLNGQPLAGFHPKTVSYVQFTTDFAALPKVSVAQPGNVTVAIQQATTDVPVATVKVTGVSGDETIYRVVFSSAATRPVFHPADISADLIGLTIDGKALPTFYPASYDYTLWVNDPATAVVEAQTPPGVTYSVSREGNLVTVRSETATQARAYRLLLGKIDPTQRPESDAFAGAALNSRWTVNRPAGGVITQAGSGVSITPSTAWWSQTAANDLKDYLTQPAQGDWQATAKINYANAPVGPGAEFGLAVMDSADAFVKLAVQGFSNASADAIVTPQTRFYVQNYFSGSPNSNTAARVNGPPNCFEFFGMQFCFNDPELPVASGTVYLRIVKTGENYTFGFSTDGTNFTGIGGTQAAPMAEPKLAFYSTKTPDATGADPTVTLESLTVENWTAPAFPTAQQTTVAGTGTTRVFADTRFAQRGDFATTNDPEANGHQHFAGGEFNNALLNIEVARDGYYTVSPRVNATGAWNSKWSFFLQIDGQDFTSWSSAGSTSGWGNLAGQVVYLKAGLHKLRLHCWTTTGFSLSAFDFTANPANRTALASAIATAEAIDPAAYTKASWTVVGDALAAAKQALLDGATNQAGLNAAAASLTAAINSLVLKPASTPTLVAPPQVNFEAGQAEVGSTVSVTSGQWTAVPDSLSYQWLRNGVPIDGATDSTYVITDDDADTKLSVRVTVSVNGQQDGVFTSQAYLVTRPVEPPKAPAVVFGPAIAGTPAIGQTLSLTGLPQAPWSLTYQWFRNGEAITAATAATYQVTTADAGNYLAALVTASQEGYETASVATAWVKVNAPAAQVTPSPAPSTTPAPTPTPTTEPKDQPSNQIIAVKAAQKSVTLVKGKKVKIAAYGYTESGKRVKVSWKSSKSKVASVSAKGVIKAKKVGKTNIKAFIGKRQVTLTVKVVNAKSKAKVKKVTVKAPKTIKVGQGASITAKYSPKAVTGVKVKFKSSNKAILSVDKAGRIWAKAAGKVKITVRAGGKSKKVTITVQ